MMRTAQGARFITPELLTLEIAVGSGLAGRYPYRISDATARTGSTGKHGRSLRSGHVTDHARRSRHPYTQQKARPARTGRHLTTNKRTRGTSASAVHRNRNRTVVSQLDQDAPFVHADAGAGRCLSYLIRAGARLNEHCPVAGS